jgi:putative transposase
MRHLNGIYTQWFNRQHSRAGHLVQGRFKSIVVEKGSYVVDLARYIVLNPVRAKMVRGRRSGGSPLDARRTSSRSEELNLRFRLP